MSISADTLPCPHCTFERTVKKDRIHNVKQNHKCKNYGRRFVTDPRNKVISQEAKELIDKLLLAGMALGIMSSHRRG